MPKTMLRPLAGVALFLVLSSMFLGGHIDFKGQGDSAATLLAAWQNWGRGSWLAFLLLQTLVAISGFVPASVVGVAAGTIYGLVFGFEIATVSTLIGAMVAFALGRSILRPWVEDGVTRHAQFRRFDDAIAQDGWRSVALLRLSPVMPFAVTSYALGLTGISWRNYVLGTLASLPSLFGYVALGCLTTHGVDLFSAGASPIKLTMLGIGAVATAGLAIHLSKILKYGLTADTPG